MHIFSRLIYLCLIIIFCDCHGPNISVNQMILNEKVCTNSEQIINSTYLKRCNELSPQDANMIITPDLVLCLAMHDRNHKICHIIASTSSPGSPENILNNVTMFEAEISKKIKEYNSPQDVSTLCESIKKPLLYSWNQTKKYAEQLEKLPDCQHACYNSQQINPLCLVIYVIDKQLKELHKKSIINHDDQYENLDDYDLEIPTEKTLISLTSETVIEKNNSNDIQLENESHDDHSIQQTHHNSGDKIVPSSKDATQLEPPESLDEKKSSTTLSQPVTNKGSTDFPYFTMISASCIIGLMIVGFFRR
ncbi:hypothetical protein HCN44_003316 [Aphidius gifuensis]|uniref:Odorant-binding protein n=1 Tax=Aphidius gifuensis TaxID=684658 RepID=A0A835CK81_APHGI|nr:hypothetical protein HCN44_003316 [Aphidius gifuensis]